MITFPRDVESIAGAMENRAITAAVAEGRPVVGYLCSYVPGEIIHAAGAVPYRLRAVGSRSTVRADAYYGARNCSFIRHVFDRALSGACDFLSGMVFMNGCDHSRRMFDNWRDARNGDFLHLMAVPHKTGETALAQYESECRLLARTLEERLGTRVTHHALSNSIVLFNRKRRLLKQIASLRSARPAAITGSEFLSVALAVTALPPEDAVTLLEECRNALAGRDVSRKYSVRLVLMGGCMEDVDHLRLIEEAGGAIVADNLCLGSRLFEGEVDEDGDPVKAIARRYLTRTACPRMIDGAGKRIDWLYRAIEETGADAVLAEKLMFCDLWGGEIFIQKSEAQKRQTPFLSLERELYGGGSGQHATRLQAFFETVANRKKKNAQTIKDAP